MSILAVSIGISACQPKQKPVEDVSVEIQKEQEQTLKLIGDREKLNLNLPKCEDKNCPELSIERLNSNQYFVDEIIDQQILQILKETLSLEDEEASTIQTDKIASEVNKESIETAKQKLERQLIPFTENFLELDQEIKALSANHKISLMIKPKILNSEGPLVTVVLNSSNYLGGAHGSSSQQYFNFDLETKKQVPLRSIIEKNELPALKEKAYEAFKTWVIESELSSDIKEYEQVWKFKLANQYYLGTQGLILQYGEYEIGPYVVGLPRLTIPYDQLHGILKEQYFPKEVKLEQATSEVQQVKK